MRLLINDNYNQMKEITFILHDETDVVLPYGSIETYTLHLPEVPAVGDSLLFDLDGEYKDSEDDMQCIAALLKKEYSECKNNKFEFKILKKMFYIHSDRTFVVYYAKILYKI